MKLRSVTLETSIDSFGLADSEGTAAALMDEEAFACFYRNTVRPFRTYLVRVSGSDTLADDLVQESYLRFLCAKAPWSDGETACRRYLFRIGTNLLRDYRRRPASTSLDELAERELPSINPSIIEQLDSESMVIPALMRMRPVERQLLWLAHAESMSYREISDITGLGVARIRLALFRSRHKLARILRREKFKSGVRT